MSAHRRTLYLGRPSTDFALVDPNINGPGVPMTTYSQGAVLTCTHDECNCRIRVETECDCAGARQAYMCTCGAEMIEVTEDVTAQVHTTKW